MAAVSSSSLTLITLPSSHYSPMAAVSTSSHFHLKTVMSSSFSCSRKLVLPSLRPSSMLLLPLRPSFFCFLSCLRSHSVSPTSIIAVRATSLDGVNSSESRSNNETREPILLPGCDYNHWLIVMEFPKDPAPTREQMIETYLSTLATVLGSMEEAKKNMYAFSTTTYTGFQCTVSEETSERFKGLTGVLWVLPDSYIDVKNKDYGGDKYINGEIVPCKFQTYQSNQRNSSKYERKKYVRRKIDPSTPIQGTLQPDSASS